MPYSEKLGKGSLGKSRKPRGGNTPEYFGSLTFDAPIQAGEKLWLAGWIKQGDNGDKFFSLVVERPAQQRRELPARQSSNDDDIFGSGPGSRSTRSEMDDEIPF